MSATLSYHSTADRPEAVITLADGLDVTTGYTFSLKIGKIGAVALLTKETGLTGGEGTITVAWEAGELAPLNPGTHTVQVTATTGGLDRVYEGTISIKGVIT